MAPGARSKLDVPMFEPIRSFGTKCTALKKVLATLLEVSGALYSDSAPEELCPPSLRLWLES